MYIFLDTEVEQVLLSTKSEEKIKYFCHIAALCLNILETNYLVYGGLMGKYNGCRIVAMNLFIH